MKIEFCWRLIFEILIIKTLPWGFVRFHKFGPDKFGHSDVYWIQTNKQTNRQTDKQRIYIYAWKWGRISKNFNILKAENRSSMQKWIIFMNYSEYLRQILPKIWILSFVIFIFLSCFFFSKRFNLWHSLISRGGDYRHLWCVKNK